MKPITLHPVSVLVGLALVGVLVVLAGATQSPREALSIPRTDVRVVGQIPAREWVLARVYASGSNQWSYTVPNDSYLVVVATEKSFSGIMANGSDVLPNGTSVADTLNVLNVTQYRSNDARVVFQPGTVLSVPLSVSSTYGGNLWGYLEPVN